jgi:hypothetical protein
MSEPIQIKVSGVLYDVHVTGEGVFTTTIDGQHLSNSSLRGLREVAQKASRRKVTVPFTLIHRHGRDAPGEVRTGTATGFHATQSKILIRYSDGSPGSLGTYFSNLMGELTVAERDELQYLLQAEYKVAQDLQDFTTRHRIHLATLVEEAIKADP